MKSLEKEVGGTHYKYFEIQPIEFCMKNNLNACQTLAIKYICRYSMKDGAMDLDKAIHVLEILKEFEYPSQVPYDKREEPEKTK
jgi:hypothetical protein